MIIHYQTVSNNKTKLLPGSFKTNRTAETKLGQGFDKKVMKIKRRKIYKSEPDLQKK
jgi:hypothetical protein